MQPAETFAVACSVQAYLRPDLSSCCSVL